MVPIARNMTWSCINQPLLNKGLGGMSRTRIYVVNQLGNKKALLHIIMVPLGKENENQYIPMHFQLINPMIITYTSKQVLFM
jgi:hypothetical protein